MAEKKQVFDYASKMAELEALLETLQDPATSLDKAIVLHTSGRKLVAELEDFLKQAENEIHKHLAKAE